MASTKEPPAKKKAAKKKTAKKPAAKKPAPKKTAIKKPPKTKEIAVIEPPQEPIRELITQKLLTRYMDTFGLGSQLNDNEKLQFIEIAKSYQLNPFKREVYAVPYMVSRKDPDTGQWIKVRQLSIITGYETYIKRADRLRVLNGWNVRTDGEGDKLKAIITIYRKDWQQPFEHEVALTEYKQENKMWKEKPLTMIKKVAISQGFRLAFPDEFGGMPYIADELSDNMTVMKGSLNDYTDTDPAVDVPLIPTDEEQKEVFEKFKKEISACNMIQGLLTIAGKIKDETRGFNDDYVADLRAIFSIRMDELKEVEESKRKQGDAYE